MSDEELRREIKFIKTALGFLLLFSGFSWLWMAIAIWKGKV
jgi:hypothetical protein